MSKMRMKDKDSMYGIGSVLIDKKAFIFLSDKKIKSGVFIIRRSNDGIRFKSKTLITKNSNLRDLLGNIENCNFLHIAKNKKRYYLTCKLNNQKYLCIVQSKNLIDWKKITMLKVECTNAKIISNYVYNKNSVLCVGGNK